MVTATLRVVHIHPMSGAPTLIKLAVGVTVRGHRHPLGGATTAMFDALAEKGYFATMTLFGLGL